jgi:hypothetical protein
MPGRGQGERRPRILQGTPSGRTVLLASASLLLSIAAGPARCEAAPAAADSTLVALFESGEDYETFLGNARARKAMWQKHWDEGQVPADVLERARALPGRWRLLVVAVDGCSDSVNTVPYLARLAALVPSIELRIVKPDAGRAVQEAHRTPDGRAATPTLVVIDEAGNEAGCWVERPKALQDGALKARADGTLDAWARDKQAWYDADAGASTVREVVAILEAAATGAPRCGNDPPPARTP